jgi:hypothetical protein
MSAVILFGGNQMWSAREAGFEDLMSRAVRHSQDDPVTCDLIAFAQHVRCLAWRSTIIPPETDWSALSTLLP